MRFVQVFYANSRLPLWRYFIISLLKVKAGCCESFGNRIKIFGILEGWEYWVHKMIYSYNSWFALRFICEKRDSSRVKCNNLQMRFHRFFHCPCGANIDTSFFFLNIYFYFCETLMNNNKNKKLTKRKWFGQRRPII